MVKTVVLLNIFVENDTFLYSSLINRNFKRRSFIWNRIFCNIIHVFTVTFDQVNVSLMNKSITSFEKRKIPLLTPNFWTVVYNFVLSRGNVYISSASACVWMVACEPWIQAGMTWNLTFAAKLNPTALNW